MTKTTVRESAASPSPSSPRSSDRWARAASRLRRMPSRRRAVLLSALVAACAVLAQWVLMVPPLYFDPYYVWEAARRWPDIPLDQWPFNEVPHQVTRIGLVLPARLAMEVFGEGQAAYFVISAVGGCLFFVGCYLVVRSLFGDLAGVASALLLVVHPFFTITNPFGHEITWSTGVMLPDMPGAGLFAIGMAALVTASRRTGRAQTRLLLAAGLFMGSSFLVREFLAFLFLPIPVYLWLLRIPWRRNLVVAAPMAGVLAFNLVHNALVWGNPMAGLRSAAGHGGEPNEPVTRPWAAGSFVRAMADWHWLGTIFLVALGLAVVGWAVTRDRRLALVLVWFLALWAPITLLSGVLDPHDISLRGWLLRYWFSVLPALLAGGFGAIALLVRRLAADGAARDWVQVVAVALAWALVGAYAVTAVRAVPDLPRDRAWNELRVWLKGRDDIPVIWADRRLAQTMTFYTRSMWGDVQWHGRIHHFQHVVPALPEGAYQAPMLYTRWRGMELQIAGGYRPSPRDGWRLLWRSSDGVLEIWDHSGRYR